ncbi:MAG: HPr family phosphocarrier protein [Zetaproteobacteria bacterium]|nr:HPr family phosphocarrier protein [Zetaproteobacteria bacterium]
MITTRVKIQNKLGLHARASAAFVALAGRFESDVFLEKDGVQVNAKSIMGLMMLAAAKGTMLQLSVEGCDEEEASRAIIALIDDKFAEGE